MPHFAAEVSYEVVSAPVFGGKTRESAATEGMDQGPSNEGRERLNARLMHATCAPVNNTSCHGAGVILWPPDRHLIRDRDMPPRGSRPPRAEPRGRGPSVV